MSNQVKVQGMGGALQALWAATGSVLGAAAVAGEMLSNTAGALNNVSLVALETSGTYLDESRATRKAKLLALNREYLALEAEPVPSLNLNAAIAAA